MQTLQEYKCPCCGGAIAFDSTLQKMKCPYCDTEFEMEALVSYDAELQSEKNDNMEWECPQCHNKDHSKLNVTRRTCGYLGENFWNTGKTKEIKSRVLHL